jgi:NitT/TauT family transport system substrate-binding protein
MVGILAIAPGAATQQPARVVLALSGWTGFAPFTLAERAGLFRQRGVEVEVKFIPQRERHLAVAAGQVQAVATTIDTHVAYTAAGVPLTQVLVIDRSVGGDGIAVRPTISDFPDLRGKLIAVDGAGTTPYFTLMAMLRRHGMTARDVRIATVAPQPAANAFVAGQFDAAVTYEPYLSQIRANPKAGRILATTVEYPVVVDTLAFPPDFIRQHPNVVRAVVNGFFDALELMAREPAKSHEIMGARVNQTADKFVESAKYLQWLDRKANQDYLVRQLPELLAQVAEIQLEAGVIRQIPDLQSLVDPTFVRP